MGRHGTGGSEDAQERGESGFWGPDNQRSDSFWGSGDQPEPPGWPSLPDQPEVTGQWAPMPRRDTPSPAQGAQSDPFETTGAFQVPPRPAADRGHPQDEQPFETTGAFARPPSWDEVQDSTQTFSHLPHEGHGPDSPFGSPRHDPFAPGDPHGAFRQDDPFAAGDPQGGLRPQQDDPFGPGDAHGGFRSPGPGDGPGGFRPQQDDDPFGSGDARKQGDPAEATGRFEPPSLPPEPGDVKVAGEPTMVARTPAWAEAETGFLGSGWSGDDQNAPESGRGRGRRKPPKDPDAPEAPSRGGRGRMALLSVAAVVVVLGGTVAGVKMMSSGDEAGCPGGKCAAVQGSSQPAPVASEPVEEETSEPLEEETSDEETPDEEVTEKETRPEPTTPRTYAPAPRRTTATPTPTPTPKPTKTRSKTPAQDEALIDEPAVEEVPEEVTEVPTSRADTGSVGTHSVPQPEETQSSDTERRTGPLSGGAGSVNVRFRVDRQQLTSYTATMRVTNDSQRMLSSFTLSMPVRGKIVKVEGAEWTQDGNLLIVDMSRPIATGDTADLKISATGRAGTPASCGLVGGECSVT